jgi:riboflavin synthase
MFTGIIEELGTVTNITQNASNVTFTIESSLAHQLKVDQSVSHNGVCLTVESISNNTYQVTAIAETLAKTNLGKWQVNHLINLERCMLMNGRLDGHIVQGHVDDVATCTQISNQNGSWLYSFEFNPKFAALVIEKGSVCVNGTSLTAFNVQLNSFSVAIIPYTYQHTNIHQLQLGNTVNIEFDILGKYLLRQKEVLNN